MNAFLHGVKREWQRIVTQPSYWVALFLLPMVSIALIAGVIAAPSVNDVPMDVVDLDQSKASRDLIFRLDASPSVSIQHLPATTAEALTRAQTKKSFGFLVIPKDYHSDLIAGRGVDLSAYVNQQSFMLGNVLSNQVLRNLMESSARESIVHLMAAGQVPAQAKANVVPLQGVRSVLGNSYLNYQSFLLASMLPHLWHVMVMLVTVIAIGSEFKAGTVGEWYRLGNDHLSLALTSKLLIPAVVLAMWITLIDLFIFRQTGAGSYASLWALLISGWVTQFSYHCAGLLVVAFSHNYRLSLSLAAFYTTPAFAFVGVTFPTFNMNWASHLWQAMMPISVLQRVQNDILHWQMTLMDVWPTLSVVAVYAFVFGMVALMLMRLKVTDPVYWKHH